MGKFRGLWVLLAVASLGCPSDEGEASDGTDTDMPTTTMMPSTTSPSTSATASSSASTTTPPTSTTTNTTDDTSASATDTDPPTTSEDATATTTGTTGSTEVTYPPCMVPGGTTTGGTTTTGGFAECPPEYDACYEFPFFGEVTHNACAIACENADECPAPSSGTAPVACAGPTGSEVCVVDCTPGAGGGTTTTGGEVECPDGMTCVDIGFMGFMRCLWEL